MDIKQDWGFYYTQIDTTPASIRLNLGLAEIAPINDFKYRTWFSIKLLSPSENGLVTNEEFQKICEIEDAISEILEQHGAIMVGAVKNNGTADLYFYSPHVSNYEELINSVMLNYKDYLYALDIKEDAEWSAYFEYLYPTEYEMQTIQNRKVLMELDQLGDNPEKERMVDHWIYFRTENDRARFIETVKPLGYTVLSEERVDGDYPYQLHIARMNNTVWANVDGYVWELVTLAKEHNGIYDGWGCPIEK